MADLKIKISGDNSGLSKALSKSRSILKGFATGATAVFAGMAAGVTAAFSIFGRLKSVIDPVAGRLDDIGKAAARIGLSNRDFQVLAFAARRTGVETTTLEKAFKRMQKVIFDAKKGLTTSKDAIQALGLSLEELEGKTPLEQFEMLARRLALVEDKTLKNGVAQDLFGRSGLAIAPLISQYDDLKQVLQDINGVITDESVKAAEDYTDALENLSTAFDSFIASTGAIEKMAVGFKNIEGAITNIRRVGITDFLDQFDQANERSGIFGLTLPGVFGNIGEAIATTGGQERLERKRKELLRKIQQRGGPNLSAEVNEAIKNFDPTKSRAAARIKTASLGSGGTLAALGGDISGGGFAARLNIQQQQLDRLSNIDENTKMFLERIDTLTFNERIDGWDRVIKSTFKD